MFVPKFKPIALSTLSFLFGLTSMSFAFAQEDQSEQDFARELEQAARAMPELNQRKEDQTRSATGMSCYVDTIAFDVFTSGYCFSAGSPFMTTAVFRIDNPPANFTILWSDSRCSSTNTLCFLPIRQYRSLTLSATVLNNSNNTFSTVSATAEYEGFF